MPTSSVTLSNSRTPRGLVPQAEFIVFCGVHFMAETADMLSRPDQAVILPNLAAGCSMADMADLDSVTDCWNELEEVFGSRARRVGPPAGCARDLYELLGRSQRLSVAGMAASFAPRRTRPRCSSGPWRVASVRSSSLTSTLAATPAKRSVSRSSKCRFGTRIRRLGGSDAQVLKNSRVILWHGFCSVHKRFTVGQIDAARRRFPDVRVIVHPECPMPVVDAADASGSTDYIAKAIAAAPDGSTFAIGTEINFVQRLANQNPQHKIFCLDSVVCPCSTMYRIHPSYIAWVLEALTEGRVLNRITVPEEVAIPARVALERMLSLKPASCMKHIIVVGSGIAGLIAALELSRKHAVTLVTKAHLEDSNTRFAQGGIAAAIFSDDSVAEHIADTLRAGAGLCDPGAVEVLCSEGPARIRDLMRLGVVFDQHHGQLARGLEAAHTRARVLHAGGDSTGLAIELALARAVRANGISVMEYTFACDLILCHDHVAGLQVMSAQGGRHDIEADAVILASGGAGQLYRHTTNPALATGDGVAMALRAAAQLADLEFYQFHPTALAVPAGPFLISEAVRGEGAVLLDANGRRFMQHIHAGAELAPRDVVARGIARQMAAQGGKPVLLDATRLSTSFLAGRFPTIDAACRAHGLDWSSTPIPVTPAAHYWMGGVRTDIWGRSSVPGLFAVGEVACTGVHGANRLASNSLLESLVFAWRCAAFLLDEDLAKGISAPSSLHVPSSAEHGLPSLLPVPQPQPMRNAQIVDRAVLQSLMWNAAGIERSAAALEAAIRQLDQWQASDATMQDLETGNLLLLARVIVAAAVARRESRGAHFREDHPETSTGFQHSLVYCQSMVKAVTRAC